MDDLNDCDDRPVTLGQVRTLLEYFPGYTDCVQLSRLEAARLIQLHNPHARWRKLSPTDKQVYILKRRNLWRTGLTRGEAADLIGQSQG